MVLDSVIYFNDPDNIVDVGDGTYTTEGGCEK